jgi:hypothetical protein
VDHSSFVKNIGAGQVPVLEETFGFIPRVKPDRDSQSMILHKRSDLTGNIARVDSENDKPVRSMNVVISLLFRHLDFTRRAPCGPIIDQYCFSAIGFGGDAISLKVGQFQFWSG